MDISLAAQLEASTLEDWFHNSDPLTNWWVREQLVDALFRAKADYREAQLMHDHARAARELDEIRDLTALCPATADGLSRQRVCFLVGKHLWPLAPLAEGEA